MPEPLVRSAIAFVFAAAVAAVMLRYPRIHRDLASTIFAVTMSLVGIYVFLGTEAVLIGGAIVIGAAVLGGVIYGLLALMARLSR